MLEQLKLLCKSFSYAYEGILYCIKNERNFRIHLVVIFYVIFFSVLANISTMQFCILLLCFSQVISSELINTALEILCNKDGTEYNIFIKNAKDVSASGVLVCAISCVIIGLIIFVPKTLEIYQNFSIVSMCIFIIASIINILFVFKKEKK